MKGQREGSTLQHLKPIANAAGGPEADAERGPEAAREAERDRLFDTRGQIGDFAFDQKVASVFDDMVSRSVPYYGEIQRMVAELARDFATEGTHIYDLGCATGTTMALLDRAIEAKDVTLVGIDNSEEMVKKARAKLEQAGLTHPWDLQIADMHDGLRLKNASVVTMLLTLQFVRPLRRAAVAKAVYEGLNDSGCLLLVEKLTCKDTMFNRLFIQHYYDYKARNGYSEVEIAKKREALENVLIPYRLEENLTLLKEAGFRRVETFFRWYNFSGIVAVK